MIEKIDFIGSKVWAYDETNTIVKETEIDSSFDDFISAFSNGEDLLTINISSPEKRIVRFFSITDGIPQNIEVDLYSDMTVGNKTILDAVVSLIESL